jgi:endoglucanase
MEQDMTKKIEPESILKCSIPVMRLMCMALVMSVLIVSRTLALTPVEKHGHLRVQGAHIVDEHGEPVVLRGYGLFWHQWPEGGPFYNKDCVNWLIDDFKCTIIRPYIGHELGGYVANPKKAIDYCDIVVQTCIDRGIYVIVNLHTYEAVENEAKAAEFFATQSKKWGGYKNVLFQPWNEPLNTDKGHNWSSVIKPYHERLVKVIRDNDPDDIDNIIILGTETWSQDVDKAADDPVAGTNLVYSLHFYCNSEWHQQFLLDKASYAYTRGLPMIADEYGFSNPSADGPFNTDWGGKWLDWLESKKIGHIPFAIGNKYETMCALKTGNTNYTGGWDPQADLKESGRFFREYFRKWNADEFSGEVSDPGPYTITLSAGSGGSIGLSPQKQEYSRGEEVTVTAVPDQGMVFGGWTGIYDTANPATITVRADMTIGASFLVEGQIIMNGTFDMSTEHWSLGQGEGYGNSSATLECIDGEAVITVTNGGTEVWHVQLTQKALALEGGSSYLLRFDARAQSPVGFSVGVGETEGTYEKYGIADFSITTGMQTYGLAVDPPHSTTTARLEFNLGTVPATTVTLDNISLKKKDATGMKQAARAEGGLSQPVYSRYVHTGGNGVLVINVPGSDIRRIEGFLPDGRCLFFQSVAQSGTVRIPIVKGAGQNITLRIVSKSGSQMIVPVQPVH